MSSRIIDYFNGVDTDIVHIAQSFATDNMSPKIEPVHLFRALLHKSSGLVNFIEDTLDEDYYYLVDWCDIHIRQCERSPYLMKKTEFSRDCQSVIKEAESFERQYNTTSYKTEFLLAALVSPGVGFTSEQLRTMPLTKDKILSCITDGPKPTAHNNESKKTVSSSGEAPNGYCIPLANNGNNTDVIGMDGSLRSFIEILARKDRANVLITGDTGVGKTSLIRGLVNLLTENRLPASICNIEPYELDLISLSQGVSYKGEMEDRFKSVVDGLTDKEHPVLVIENFHRIGEASSSLNAIMPNIKKILSNNSLQFICTASVDGYTKNIEKDRELTAYFERISLEAPSEEIAVEILDSKKNTYEQYHNITLGTDVIPEVVRLAKRYMPERNLPSSAIDLLDRTMASVKIENELSAPEGMTGNEILLHKDEIRNVVSKMTGIPMGNIQSEERQKLSNAEEILHKRVVGQNHAIKSILDAVFESRSGLNKKGQPIGSFFFLGPTGTGKTELAKALAEFLFNDDTSILRFDMSEYKEEHSVALLYGAPPGYVGYEEGGLLVNQIRQHPYSVVLFDEIEKAHRSVFDLFLQILDEGKLHDRLGRVGDFSNALIIFTSNIGSDYIFKSFGEGHVPTHDQMLEVMQGQFRPEFLARLTEIVPFSPITPEMIDRIFDIHLQNLLKMLKEQNISLTIDESARKYITKVGFNAHYGARPILGIIRKEIRRPLSKLIISGDINSGDSVTMKYSDETREIAWDIETPD
ncbi:AAA family ATPase [Xylanibacter muris]|uniref:ATP-dependent Clp protease ATP-binding subunit n=1 Tax=Xylanibacter muris TaxID=2736290 RepID=A0ABX2AMD2_9BACT|nr:ATP-dependent Clp protease ATP-binding subunit [Xylanibacter muris]NPD91742.1 ATP-dependent Clp protease ATP-binding subunit [Xylanibacter muris]